jgi:hypothetical protein
MKVAVVDCSLPIDHPNHVTYRDATAKEVAEMEAEQNRPEPEEPRDLHAEVDQIKEHLGL